MLQGSFQLYVIFASAQPLVGLVVLHEVSAVCGRGITGMEYSSAAEYALVHARCGNHKGRPTHLHLQPVGEDVLHKLQMKKERWNRHAKLNAVEQLLWGRQPRLSMKHRLCSAAKRAISSLLHDARLSVEDMSIVVTREQLPKVRPVP